MNFKYYLYLFSISILAFSVSSCSDDDDVDTGAGEEEVITSMLVTLVPPDGGDGVLFSFLDPDGDGGIDPVVMSAPLAANTEYAVNIQLLNETEEPAENVTEEIEEEDEEHQFFFVVDGVAATVAYLDQDGDGNPIGLLSSLTTQDAGSGTYTVTLRHEPAKGAEGVSDGDITNAGGETDIEVEFDLVVE